MLRFHSPSRRGLRQSFVAWVRTGARPPSRSSGLRGALQVKEPALLSTLGRKPSSHAKCVEPPQDELKTLIGNILSALSNGDGKPVQFEAIGPPKGWPLVECRGGPALWPTGVGAMLAAASFEMELRLSAGSPFGYRRTGTLESRTRKVLERSSQFCFDCKGGAQICWAWWEMPLRKSENGESGEFSMVVSRAGSPHRMFGAPSGLRPEPRPGSRRSYILQDFDFDLSDPEGYIYKMESVCLF